MEIKIDMPKGERVIDLTPFKEQLTLEVTLDLDDSSMFSMFCSGYSDMFGRPYIGYWAYGVTFFEEDNAWLCIEENEEFSITDDACDQAIEKYKEYRENNWEGLEPGNKVWTMDAVVTDYHGNMRTEQILCFVSDPEFACRAVAAAYKRWGQDSIDNWDADTVDFGAQMALYGQLKWG